MRRTSLVLVPAAAAAAAVGLSLIAASGSAQSPLPASMHLVGKQQKHVGFFPHRRPRQGDTLGFGDRVSGDDTGTDRGICTVIGSGANQAVCIVHVQLSRGTLTGAGRISFRGRAKNLPFTITGGTGAYDGARGTVLVTDTSETTTDLKVMFRP